MLLKYALIRLIYIVAEDERAAAREKSKKTGKFQAQSAASPIESSKPDAFSFLDLPDNELLKYIKVLINIFSALPD